MTHRDSSSATSQQRLTDLCQRTITLAISCCVHHHASRTDWAPPVCRAVTMQYSCWQHCHRALLVAHERKFALGSRSFAQYPRPRCPTDTNTSDFRRQIRCFLWTTLHSSPKRQDIPAHIRPHETLCGFANHLTISFRSMGSPLNNTKTVGELSVMLRLETLQSLTAKQS